MGSTTMYPAQPDDLPDDFRAILAQAQPCGDFLQIEQLFLDAQHFADSGRPVVRDGLIKAASELYHPDSEFIEDGKTADTEVYFEAYRRCFYDATTAVRLGTLDICMDPEERENISAFLRDQVVSKLVEISASQPDSNVIDFAARRRG